MVVAQFQCEILLLRRGGYRETATRFRGRPAARGGPFPNTKPGGLRVEMTLEQACPPEY